MKTESISGGGSLDVTKVGYARTIFVAHTFTDCDTGFLIGVLQDHNLGQFNTKADYRISLALSLSPADTYRSATRLASSG
jgi:hypothetical protein